MKPDQFQHLIERYISEKCTPEEMETLRRLLKEPEYVAVLDNIMDEQLENNMASANDYPGVVSRLKASLEKEMVKEKTETVRRLSIRRWAAAAAILIALGTGAFFLFADRSSKPALVDNKPQPIDILPGKQGAILTLADGSTVILDSMGNGLVAMQNGSKILLENGKLKYNADGLNNAEIVYNIMTTPKGRQFQLVLPDGTKVWLNAASSLRYPIVFTGKERVVDVTGEAYFEVAKSTDPSTGQKIPFKVKVNNETEIEVLGTHFNINSYNNEASINTTLLEGSVRIINGDKKVVLRPGQQAQVDDHGSHQIKIENDVNLEKVMAWKNGLFNFQDAKLEEVMRQLERWYDIEVVYEKGIPALEFMGKMGNDLSLSEVLRGLQMSEVHFRIEEGKKLVVMP